MIKAEDFWKNAQAEGDCLIWKGVINPKPLYGILQITGGRLIAHRVAYELEYGPLPKHAHVIRTCNNPLCIKPGHLRLANSLKASEPKADLKKKIENCVEKIDGCWIWKGEKPKSIILPEGIRLLRRGIFELFKEPLRKSQEVIRSCNNHDCLNPDHLTCIEKSKIEGTNAKLTFNDVKDIRAAVLAGPINIKELSKKYNTSRQTIHSVIYNKGWHDPSYNPPEKVVKIVNRAKKSLADRFWQKVDKSGECWIWNAYSHNGFGHFSVDHIPKMAHRVAYELSCGPIPPGTKVLHSCGNDLCVRPEHLSLSYNSIAAK